jgi:hypothetical protein
MQLVREIEVGMDVDGDGTPDLDPSRIYYAGVSQGGDYGTIFMAVEPDVSAGTLTVAGGRWVDLRLGTIGRDITRDALSARVPSLINAPGIAAVDGLPVNGNGPYFNENLPLRDGIPFTVHLQDGTEQVIQSPVINIVPGAMAIQQVLEDQAWVMISGDSLAYAPHLRRAPLSTVPAKSVIYQFAKGDETAPNPATSALLRAGDLADRATFYRHDLARAENPQLPENPHSFISDIASFGPIALGAQEQMANFFASDGTEVIHPEPARFFETPIQGPLPEDLSFDPLPPSGPISPSSAAVVGTSSQVLSDIFGGVPAVLSSPARTVDGLVPLDRGAALELISSFQVPVAHPAEPSPLAWASRRRVNIGAYQASASAFVVTVPGTVSAGTPFDVTVQAVDVFGQVAFGYRGTVTFSVTDPDPAVVLPADYMFAADDQVTHTFTGEFTLITPGKWTLTAADLANGLSEDVMLTVNP